MSKSILYAVNATPQTLTAIATPVTFGSVIRRYGCNANLFNGNVSLKGEGYYLIEATFNVNATNAADAVITLYNNGVAIPGASVTVTTTADEYISVTVPAIVRKTCCNETTITATIANVTGSVVNASVVVEKE